MVQSQCGSHVDKIVFMNSRLPSGFWALKIMRHSSDNSRLQGAEFVSVGLGKEWQN